MHKMNGLGNPYYFQSCESYLIGSMCSWGARFIESLARIQPSGLDNLVGHRGIFKGAVET
jgi:hypothetical protein